MKTKLAVMSAAALLAGTLFAAAQQQPGGAAPEQPPQGEDAGMQSGSSLPSGGMNQGTVGTGQSQGKAQQKKNLQPGNVPPREPPQGSEPASPNPQ
jgi:opacity protein-like surface antigen